MTDNELIDAITKATDSNNTEEIERLSALWTERSEARIKANEEYVKNNPEKFILTEDDIGDHDVPWYMNHENAHTFKKF